MKAILVDCFDTIIFRNCHPEYVKEKWAEKICSLLGLEIKACQVYQIRINAEKRLEDKNCQLGLDHEFRVMDLYKAILESLYVGNYIKSIDESVVYQMHQIELDLEMKSHILNTDMVDRLKKYKDGGDKIYLVSDFYMGGKDVEIFFKNLGIYDLFDGIYVSSEYLKKKQTGRLYEIVLENLKICPSDALMIGDNALSDQKVPKRMGINIKPIKAPHNQANCHEWAKPVDNVKKIFKYYSKLFYDNQKYNFENYAFMLYAFVWSLVRHCEENKIDKLFFLSREGQILKKLFDKYCALNKISNIETKYLQVSRNSTFLASLKNIKNEKFDRLFREISSMSIKDFLISLSFTDAEIDQIKQTYNNDMEIKIEDLSRSKEFENLKANDIFIQIYDDRRNEQKCVFKEYLSSLGYEDGSVLNIVDVGWKGTMQDNIMNIYDGRIQINGFYIGLTNTGSVMNGSHKYGLLFDLVAVPSSLDNMVYSYWYLNYEQILRADHSKVIAYKKEDNVVRIEYDKTDDTVYYKQYLHDFHHWLIDKFVAIDKIVHSHSTSYKSYCGMCNYVYIKMMENMKMIDYKLVRAGELMFVDSFGRVYEGMKVKVSLKDYWINKLRAVKLHLKYNRKKGKNG